MDDHEEAEWDLDVPRWKQLYTMLRGRIECGTYQPRHPIPSLRQLQEETGLSRNTILVALRRLRAEGYVRPVHGVGTFVRLPEEWQPALANDE